MANLSIMLNIPLNARPSPFDNSCVPSARDKTDMERGIIPNGQSCVFRFSQAHGIHRSFHESFALSNGISVSLLMLL